MYVRLYHRTPETVKALTNILSSYYPAQEIRVISQQESNSHLYSKVHKFRDMIALAALAVLLITITGLIGYVNDEIRRRTKEIAIRKVNGAGTGDILLLLFANVWWITLPAAFTGVFLSWLIGKQWLEQFHEQVLPGFFPYMGIVLFVLAVILVSVLITSYRIAIDNPVNSIKGE